MLLCFSAAAVFLFKFIFIEENLAAEYEALHYNTSYYRNEFYAADLCVVSDNIDLEAAPETSQLKAAGLFDVNEPKTEFAYEVHKQIYPASTTKIMTALVALKNADVSDVVTISANADSGTFATDEATCKIKKGDQITLEDLLYGLLLNSGNDTAVAIAEHVGGSVEGFAEMMNQQAKDLMATNTNFINPSGLYHDDHYTTAYDLYLIFNECIKHEKFVEIINAKSHTANVTGEDGSKRTLEFKPTNYYAAGVVDQPNNATVIGGKTGTLKAAGNCLILLEKDKEENPYISVIMGAESKDILYRDMTTLIQSIPANNP